MSLDTSGAIRLVPAAADPDGPLYAWSDLDPFTQGYTAQILEMVGAAFHQLAPETLAAILKDCAANTSEFPQPHGYPEVSRNNGRHFWMFRRAGFWPAKWPRLIPYLAEGLVYLRKIQP